MPAEPSPLRPGGAGFLFYGSFQPEIPMGISGRRGRMICGSTELPNLVGVKLLRGLPVWLFLTAGTPTEYAPGRYGPATQAANHRPCPGCPPGEGTSGKAKPFGRLRTCPPTGR